MSTELKEYHIATEGKWHHLYHHTDPVNTPNANPIASTSLPLMEAIIEEAKEELDVSTLSLYSMFCTQIDFGEQFEHLGSADFKHILMVDRVLQPVEGPAHAAQFVMWDKLFDYLKERNLEYPHLPQVSEIMQAEMHIEKQDQAYQDNWARLVKQIKEDYAQLTPARKTVVINALNLFQAPVYGLLLVMGLADQDEFADALLAAQGMIPEVMGEVNAEEYEHYVAELKRATAIFMRFVELS